MSTVKSLAKVLVSGAAAYIPAWVVQNLPCPPGCGSRQGRMYLLPMSIVVGALERVLEQTVERFNGAVGSKIPTLNVRKVSLLRTPD